MPRAPQQHARQEQDRRVRLPCLPLGRGSVPPPQGWCVPREGQQGSRRCQQQHAQHRQEREPRVHQVRWQDVQGWPRLRRRRLLPRL